RRTRACRARRSRYGSPARSPAGRRRSGSAPATAAGRARSLRAPRHGRRRNSPGRGVRRPGPRAGGRARAGQPGAAAAPPGRGGNDRAWRPPGGLPAGASPPSTVSIRPVGGCDLNGGTLRFCDRFRARRMLAPSRPWIGGPRRVSEPTAIGRIQTGGGSTPPAPQAFSVGEALVQPSLNRVSIGGQATQVEPKLMQVLLLMAERPGAVVPRETFFRTVWAGTVGDD